MNLLQKLKQTFAKNDNDKLNKLLSQLSAKQYISKQTKRLPKPYLCRR